jgi:hypothetical protein
MLFSPTRMPRRIFFASLLASACSFDGDGTGGNPNLGPGSADASSSGNDPSEGEPSSSDPSETTGDDPTGETTTPVGTTGNEPGDPARLLYAPEALDFGNIANGDDYTLQLELRNAGGSAALLVTDILIPGAFGLSNGYPGMGGDCGDMLGPGERCRIGIGFHPDTIGPHLSAFDLQYYDGVDLGQPVHAPVVALRGGGVGETENLVVNPGAESSLDGWTMMDSTWEAIAEDVVDGGFAFEAGNPALGTTTLTQTIGLAEWTNPLAAGGMHYRFAASAKAPEEGSLYRIDLDFGTGAVTPLMGVQSDWDAVNVNGPVPLGATSVTVTLTCSAVALMPCGARFDALSLSLVYPPPS